MRRLKYETRKTVRFAGITAYCNRYVLNRKFYYQVGLRVVKIKLDLVIESEW